MPRQRTSRKKAELTGQVRNHPGRFKGRSDPPKGNAVGPAPESLSEAETAAWDEFVEAWPWVAKSDRAALELLCVVAARVREPNEESKVSLLSTYRQLVADFGGSPTSRNRIDWDGDEDDKDDPFAQLVS